MKNCEITWGRTPLPVAGRDKNSAVYLYDGDGNRVKATVNGTVTVYQGNYYEATLSAPNIIGSTVKYYFANGQMVAERANAGPVQYMITNTVGSVELITDSNFNVTTTLRYDAWGKIHT